MSGISDERLSAEATTLVFDNAIPPLRAPFPASQEEGDDPSTGPFVLAFKDHETWLSAWQNCEAKVAEQCEAGARMSCSIGATRKCKPPWWSVILPFLNKSAGTAEEREACEQKEMFSCVSDATEKCNDYAKDICKEAFSEARVAYFDHSANSHSQFKYRHVKCMSRESAMQNKTMS